MSNIIQKKSSKNLPIPDDLYPVIIGIALGDAHIYRNKTENASLHIEQAYKKEEYLNHLYDLLKDFCKSQPVIRARTDKRSGEVHQSIRFTTRQLPCFTQLHDLFYNNGTKIVPLNIEDLITSVCLAYWAMDDGGKAGSGFHYNTHSFSLSEVQMLSSALLNKFGLINTIQSSKNGHRIYITSKSMNNFRTLVKPHFQASMLYKLD
jgi:hypothetical protein